MAGNHPARTAPSASVAGSGPGRPLDPPERAWFEQRLGHDFSQVRIHTDDEAATRAHALGARAFTAGTDILVGAPDVTATAVDERSLLAHELAHVVQQREPGTGPISSTEQMEADADAAARTVSAGGAFRVRSRATAGTPLCQSRSVTDRDEGRRMRGTGRTLTNPDVGRAAGRQRQEEGLKPGLPMNQSATEAMLQSQVQLLRPTIPAFSDLAGMGTFDSDFYGQRGPFDFRGQVMAGWEVNYYFISMAMAHQGWDWNETQSIIWAWNKSQELGINPYGGGEDMTPEMWFASWEGFRDEQERMAQEALGMPSAAPAPAQSPPP
ncbi:MAG TPA: DUF4157 domain-containing protein [Streptosporangiaceae bacterium]|jgi:hypothetical protein